MRALRLRRACGLAVGLLLTGCGGGEDAPVETVASSFATATDTLREKVASAGPYAPLPAPSDPAVTAFESATARALPALGTAALPATGFDSYDSLCRNAAGIIGSYFAAGVDRVPQSRMMEVMNANIERSIGHLFTPLLFSAHCIAVHAPVIEKNVGEDVESQVSVLHFFRNDAHMQAGTLLDIAGAPPLGPSRRHRLLELLADDAPSFAIVLRPDQRQALADKATSLRDAVAPASQPLVDRIAAGFTRAPCNALCRM